MVLKYRNNQETEFLFGTHPCKQNKTYEASCLISKHCHNAGVQIFGMKNFSSVRTLHLIDLDNLVGTPMPSPEQAKLSRLHYMDVIKPKEMDQTVIATSHLGACTHFFSWPPCRRLIRSGFNGADLALLEVWDEIPNSYNRFSEVVIASGDHIFAPFAAQLRKHDITVTVVAPMKYLSFSLKMVANQVIYFDYLNVKGHSFIGAA